jgi:hypothetical protein
MRYYINPAFNLHGTCFAERSIEAGEEILDYFSKDIKERISSALKINAVQMIKDCPISEILLEINPWRNLNT